MEMDTYLRDPRLPEGFRECLGKNAKALQRWCAMTEAEQNRCLQELAPLHGAALERYVDGLAGWERGHAPYQL